MEIIKKLSSMIDDELNDAMKYAKCALVYKDDRPGLSRVFYALSQDETEHMNKLHDAVVEIIKAFNDDGGVVSEDMQSIYNYLHEKHVEEAMEVKRFQDMYKSN